MFTGDVSGNLIHRDILQPDGATFAAHRAKDGVEFLASTDVWFRPCNFTNAPDGNLYLTDIYRQVIETPESIPEEIRKKINFFNGDTLGRIYRIVPNHPRRAGRSEAQSGRGRLRRTGQTTGQSEWMASSDGASAAARTAGPLCRSGPEDDGGGRTVARISGSRSLAAARLFEAWMPRR